MKYPRLLAACVAILLVVTTVLWATHEAREFEARNERRVAAYFFPQKMNGSALQRLAFSMPHYLPIYGSSELGSYELQKRVKTKPGDFFLSKPTGFVAFPVGRGGSTPLVMLQDLAAVGKMARGHKVVVVLSPNWFAEPLNVKNYEGNASQLHLGSVLFGQLSTSLKQAVARRQAQFPHPLAKSDLLQMENSLYASGDPKQLLLAKALTPVGKGWLYFLGVADDFETVIELCKPRYRFPEPPPRQRQFVDWVDAEVDAEAQADVEASWVGKDPGAGKEPKTQAKTYTNDPPKKRLLPAKVEFATSDVWGDYDLLLRELYELHAKVLVLSVPQDGPIQDKDNVSYAMRKVYYDKVHDLAAKYGYPALTFEEHEYDGNFLIEHVSHLTDKGWLYFDQVIDAFYHDKL